MLCCGVSLTSGLVKTTFQLKAKDYRKDRERGSLTRFPFESGANSLLLTCLQDWCPVVCHRARRFDFLRDSR